MITPDLKTRVIISLEALGISWFVSGITFGFYLRDPAGSSAFLLCSLPFFAVAWVLARIPIIAMSNRILRIPIILLGIAGAVSGYFAFLLPFVVLGVLTTGIVILSGWHWNSPENAMPVFAVGIGACTVIIYHRLLSRASMGTGPKTRTE